MVGGAKVSREGWEIVRAWVTRVITGIGALTVALAIALSLGAAFALFPGAAGATPPPAVALTQSPGQLAQTLRTSRDTTEPTATVTRIGGANRWEVAVKAARLGWDPGGKGEWAGVKDIVVVNGENGKEADPITAAGLAGVCDAPILLVQSSGVPAATRSVIASIAAHNNGLKIHIVGGTGSVPATVWKQLQSIPKVSKIEDRIAGSDRYEVTINITRRIFSVVGTENVPAVMLVDVGPTTILQYDLAASPFSYRAHVPMLGFSAGTIKSTVKAYLKGDLAGKPVYRAWRKIDSDPLMVSLGVTQTVGNYGGDRIEGAIIMAQKARELGWIGFADFGVVTAVPDALAGGAFMGKRNGFLMINMNFAGAADPLNSSNRRFFLWINNPNRVLWTGWIIGGPASVPAGVETEIRSLLIN